MGNSSSEAHASEFKFGETKDEQVRACNNITLHSNN
jgi:hypothetical protein